MPVSNVVEGAPIETAWGNDVADAVTTLETHPADTTAVHGIADTSTLYRAGGTDVAVADGGTGASTAAAAATALGLGTGSTPQFAGIEVGAAADTTVTRLNAGDIQVEGNRLYRAGGTDVAISDGGTNASTAAAARANLGLGMTIAEVVQAGASSNLAPLTTSYQDIPGATLSLTVVATDLLIVIAVFDFQVTTAGAATNALGQLVVNGVAQSVLALRSMDAVGRGTHSQTWLVSGLAAGARVFKLQAEKTTSSGVVNVNAGGTNLLVLRLSAA